jgi:hypothetical protein
MSETDASNTGTDASNTGGSVHWVGTGLSSGSGLRELADQGRRVVVWGRTVEKAEGRLALLGMTGRAATRKYAPALLAAEVRPGDIVVSMLPATEHPVLLRLCVERNAHFACSSYVSEPLLAEAEAAEKAGLAVLTEAGLDPGIDHLFADLLVARGREVVGDGPAEAEFTSYCGGIPAVPNEFRYRFSWAPRGVLGALRAPARYIEDGAERTVDLPWTVTRPHVLDGEPFEAYPNRDSVPYLTQYAFPASWRPRTFVRGTLRLEGWLRAWDEVFTTVRAGDGERIAALADELAARHPTTDADRDRVVLAVALTVRGDDGAAWRGEYLLEAVGDATESAMARLVSLPLAYGIGRILDGDAPVGLRQAAQGAEDARRWLEFLGERGVGWRYAESPAPDEPPSR